MFPFSRAPKYKVDSKLEMLDIKTALDSELAKYYLENYLSGEKSNSSFDKKIDEIHFKYSKSNPDKNVLLEISGKTSLDFAAIYFAYKTLKQKGNTKLQKDFLKYLSGARNNKLSFIKNEYDILLVPGFDYVDNGHITGADFAKPKVLLKNAGFNVRLVEIDPIGSVEENALFISETIRKSKNKKLLIGGASSAGPAIHLALGNYLKPNETKHVKAWLNLGGILQGSPLLDIFSKGFKGSLFNFVVWIKKWRMRSFDSMRSEISQIRFKENNIPKHILIVNYIGMSLSGNISKFASDKYRMMKDLGPNDGLALLPDLLAPNSLTILAEKSDHFFAEDPEIDIKTVALLKTIVSELKKK
ncbi:hypothetical protein ACQV5M_07645 [Leptospira sp. SA-E8]|uniref:hypothetical protein n=1 Tax=Leptospira sp. SA-E8 TaxID=3422259 RepID=UPI003EBF6A4B